MGAAKELNGDGPLAPRERLTYLWRNAWRNLRATSWGKTHRFVPRGITAADVNQRSPSRLLTDCFIMSMLPRLFPVNAIDMLEIGCGSGSMMRRLAALGYSGTYVGVDIGSRFEENHGTSFRARFVQSDAHLYAPPQPINFLFSFSALEHIANDEALIARLSPFVRRGGAQMHVVPAAAGLWIYLWHGYRQYTAADLEARFGEDARIYRIGGVGSLLVHFLFITLPEVFTGRSLRRGAPGVYAWIVLGGLTIDRVLPFFPSALVVFKQH
ncbi:MAG: class I SAM-dependent methyltransferase [Pseudorhodoplanes sp.]